MRAHLTAAARRPELRYLFFGALNTAFAYALYTVVLLVLDAFAVPGDYAIATALSWIISNLTSFVLQRRYVFRSRGHRVAEFIRFSSVTFGAFLANIGLGTFAVVVLGLTGTVEKLVSQLVITIVLVVVTYVLHRVFSFRTGPRRPAPAPPGTAAVAGERAGADQTEQADTRPIDSSRE